MMVRKAPNAIVLDALKAHAQEAYDRGDHLEAGIILFQTVEALLRWAIWYLGQIEGVSTHILNREVEPEQSFARLVLYLDLVCPSNGVSADLRDLKSRRNRLFHRLFTEFESVEDLRDQLRQFCRDCTNLNVALRSLVETKIIPGRSGCGEQR